MVLLRWLLHQLRVTGRELYADRHEMSAWLFVLAVLAFLIFIYPYQKSP